ncbi:MAG: triose-phosphate isomerase [bacterium]|nr:triose-phosphate isomerase [bacterium]
MKKKKIIVGNWKMAPQTIEEAKKTFAGIKKIASTLRNVDTIVCPPFVFVHELGKRISGKRCLIGAQDVFWKEEGAYTGEISPLMLRSLGARYVIVGHSERRALGETDEMVSKKVDASLRVGLMVIICVGELSRDQHGEYTKRIEEQLKQSLSRVQKKSLQSIIIAYEPVWAIGANAIRSASPEDVLEISILIRKVLTNMFDRESSHIVPILYGGSVDAKNCGSFMREGGADGLLVGRASLDGKQFGEILKVAEQSAKKK